MDLGLLLELLAKSGIFLMPQEEDTEQANIGEKSILTENKAIEDICMAVKGFYIQSSRFNGITH